MENLLNSATQITSTEYCNLPGTPKFKGQTSLDSNLKYWTLFESEGKLYKIHNNLL